MSDMTVTGDVVAHWLPRRFMMSSTAAERTEFERAFGGTLFLLVKLRSYSDALALGLQSTCPLEIQAPSSDFASVLGAPGPTAEATNLTRSGSDDVAAFDDWIATPIAHEPRFVVPLRKRVADGSKRITVGRSYDCDIVFREQSVSKLHAYFEATSKGDYILVDAESKNLSRVNGTIVKEPVILRAGSIVQLGRVEAKVCSAAALWNRLANA